MFRIFSFVFLALSLSATAFAFPINKNLSRIEFPATFTENYNFEGIVALSNCSGSLIRLEGAQDSDNGLILTNGHCFEGGFAEPGAFTSHKPSNRTFTLLSAAAANLGKVTASEVIYSTMTKTDITLYKLHETYAQIMAKYGIHALVLSSQKPQLNDPIEVISGYWKRGYSCGIELFVKELREDKWTMQDSMRYSRPGCETIGGTSGSPVVKPGTNIVVGINNTGNDEGQKCTMDNPCEVDGNGNIIFVKGYSYGQQTYWIYTCLNNQHEFDLSVNGCLLQH